MMDNGASSYHRFLCGDESAFAEIVKGYSNHLIYFINGFVNNLCVSEDLMEDVFVDLIVYRNRFKGKSSFKTFLFSIARNKAVDYIRKNKREVPIYLEEESPLGKKSPLDKESDREALETGIIQNEQNRMVSHALSKMKSEYRTVLILLYFEDMGYDDISRILKKTNKQVKNLAYSARKSLKAILEKEGFQYEEL